MTVGPICLPDQPHSGRLSAPPTCVVELLDGDRRARGLELGPGLVGCVLGDLLQERLGSAVDQILGLLQAQTGDDLANDLDDADLLVAGGLEDDVELRLLLGGLGGCACCGAGCGRDGDRRGGGDVEGLLERLHELGELEQGQFLERVEQILSGQLCHGGGPSLLLVLSLWWCDVRGFYAAASSAAFFSCSAAANRATCAAGAWNSAAAWLVLAFIAPASLASSTSRDSRSAILSISVTVSGRPSM